MKPYREMTQAELRQEYEALTKKYKELKSQKLDLNMSRGKPGKDQLSLSMPMLDILGSGSDCKAEDGFDYRNYGCLGGIRDAQKLFGEYLGIEMIPVPMNDNGPDMDLIEELVKDDESVKGIWCVPKYSNPSGITYSDEVVQRFAAMKTKARDFRIFWDNAYACHFLDQDQDTSLLNILDECKKAGNPDRPYIFASTNKITFPGAGVAFFAASKENVAYVEKQLSMQAISWDKLNMLRHVRFLKDMVTWLVYMTATPTSPDIRSS